MPAFDIVINSTSVLFLIGAILISSLFPENPTTKDFVWALFCWFVALGFLYWIKHVLQSLVAYFDEDNLHKELWVNIGVAGYFVQLIFLVVGIYFLISALTKLK